MKKWHKKLILIMLITGGVAHAQQNRELELCQFHKVVHVGECPVNAKRRIQEEISEKYGLKLPFKRYVVINGLTKVEDADGVELYLSYGIEVPKEKYPQYEKIFRQAEKEADEVRRRALQQRQR